MNHYETYWFSPLVYITITKFVIYLFDIYYIMSDSKPETKIVETVVAQTSNTTMKVVAGVFAAFVAYSVYNRYTERNRFTVE